MHQVNPALGISFMLMLLIATPRVRGAERHISDLSPSEQISRAKETPQGPKYGRYCKNGWLRAGFPCCLGRFAKPSFDCDYTVGYVGGGTLFGGELRKCNEGTFGMDYSGHWFSRCSWLLWSHGARYQGGAGRYETDGPYHFARLEGKSKDMKRDSSNR